MASFLVKSWCIAIALLAVSYGSQAQNNAISITARAMLCFNNMTIYKNCQGQYRLTPNGTLSVPKNATNFFCNGPCMAETQLVLGCVDGILSNFQFYNGATIQAVNATILLAPLVCKGRAMFKLGPCSIHHLISRPNSRTHIACIRVEDIHDYSSMVAGDFNVSKNIITAPGDHGGSIFHSSHVHIQDVGNLSLWIGIFLIVIFVV